VGILRKRRKKRHLIEEIHESKAKSKTVSHGIKDEAYDSGRYLQEYEGQLKKLKFSVILATILLLVFWWIPLAGPMIAGYVVGRFAGRKWLAVKAMIVPVLLIAVIVNLIQFGIIPGIDPGREIGSFFLVVSPGLYHSVAPAVIPVAGVFAAVHNGLGVGSNGYLIISLMMAYLGGVVAERKTHSAESGAKRKPVRAGTRGSDGGKGDGDDGSDPRFLYRRRGSEKEGFGGITSKLGKIARQKPAPNRISVSTDFPASGQKEGWMRKDKNEHAGAVADSGNSSDGNGDENRESFQENGRGARPVPRYVSRPTADTDSDEGSTVRHRRTITGGAINGTGSRGRTTVILPEEDGPDGVERVRRVPAQAKPQMNRAIVDRAVRSYGDDARARGGASGSDGAGGGINRDPECQMGHSYRQKTYDSL
jgi:hypothetical protein